MKRRLTLMLSVSSLILCGGTAAASAATPNQAPVGHHRYCVARADRPGSMRRPAATCYLSFRAAISAATGGRARLPASATPRTATPDVINRSINAPDASYVLSIDFQNINFGGNALYWTQSSKCGYFTSAGMPTGWNDTISSVITENGCATTLFWNANFGTPTYNIGRNSSASSLGSFNDQTTSEKWCTKAPC